MLVYNRDWRVGAAASFFDILECVQYVLRSIYTSLRSPEQADRSVCVPKRINTTRWSCRADSSKAIVQGYPEIKNALAEFADNPNEVPKVRSESNGLYERMCLLETGIYSVFWNDILERVNATSRKLQLGPQTRFECGSGNGSVTEQVCRGQT